MECLRETKEGIFLSIFLVPKSSYNRIEGFYNGSLKIKIASPPFEGQANKTCLKFLSKQLGIPRSRLTISSGEKSRQKVLLLKNCSVHEIRERLAELL